ncbi:MAG: SRPBCC domain-containing protein [Alphaproteobacteria bacterium]|nr:SRPBCC domain-containing protein [Alphaproteobacteria bacterium]
MSAIRRQINIAAPTRTVWNMLTTSDGWCAWYADQARVDGRKGGRVVLTIEDDDGNPVDEVGTIHTWRPTSRLEISWDSSSPAVTKGTRLTFNLARDGDETRVALIHGGAGVLEDPEGRAELDKTWRRALKALQSALED